MGKTYTYQHFSDILQASNKAPATACNGPGVWPNLDKRSDMSDRTTRPQRIQRKRTKDWKMPNGAVYVGRPSRYGNPFVVGERDFYGEVPTAEHAVRLYASWMATPGIWSLPSPPDLEPLRGKNLACWCPIGSPCHADVLLEMANS